MFYGVGRAKSSGHEREGGSPFEAHIRRCGSRRVYASVVFYEKIAGRQKMYSVPAAGFC